MFLTISNNYKEKKKQVPLSHNILITVLHKTN